MIGPTGLLPERKSSIGRAYGWRPDTPSANDFHYSAPHTHIVAAPPRVDLRPKCPPVRDQGHLGACTGFAWAFNVHFDLGLSNPKYLDASYALSELFIYYNERSIENTVGEDAGAEIRDGAAVIAKVGACYDRQWPYIMARFREKPPTQCYIEALKTRAIVYSRVAQTLQQLRGCLAEGFPVVFGFSVYPAMESEDMAKTGRLPMPRPREKSLGGHAVALVGYDDDKRHFLVRNSWGKGWGEKGYFWMPYAYVLDPQFADDFWTIRSIGK